MNDLERLFAERDCRRLMSLYCRYIDAHDHEALLDLWTPDALWVSVRDEMKGRDEIRAYLDRKPRGLSHHLCGNPWVEVESESVGYGVCDFVVHVGEDDPEKPGERRFRTRPLIGRYRDVYRHLDGRWLFAERRTGLFPAAS